MFFQICAIILGFICTSIMYKLFIVLLERQLVSKQFALTAWGKWSIAGITYIAFGLICGYLYQGFFLA